MSESGITTEHDVPVLDEETKDTPPEAPDAAPEAIQPEAPLDAVAPEPLLELPGEPEQPVDETPDLPDMPEPEQPTEIVGPPEENDSQVEEPPSLDENPMQAEQTEPSLPDLSSTDLYGALSAIESRLAVVEDHIRSHTGYTY